MQVSELLLIEEKMTKKKMGSDLRLDLDGGDPTLLVVEMVGGVVNGDRSGSLVAGSPESRSETMKLKRCVASSERGWLGIRVL